jgi:hypothetical protein
MKRSILSFVLFVFFTSLGFGQGPMNVLFIGNSYTHYNNMPNIFQEIAVSKGVKINVEMSAKSNHTCKMHCERPEMFEKIASKKWDYVVLQGFSRELGHDPEYLDTSFVPYFNQIVDSVYSNNACTNVLLYMTWGYSKGIPDNPELSTFQKMSDKIAQGYQYISDLYSVPIVPVGKVWETVHLNYPQINLYVEDNMHPSINGSYLIASTFYSAIFKATPADGFQSKLDDETAEIIQTNAYNYVSANLDRFDLKLNTLEVKYERTSKGLFIASCKSYYPNATSLLWDFGDGITSDQAVYSHRYKKAGIYNISLKVVEPCGERIIYRKVYFKDLKKPKKNKPSVPVTSSEKSKKI